MSLRGKVAIVTGGGRGIGKEYCLALLNEGAKVCVCDVDVTSAKEFIEELPENLRDRIIFRKCDVTNYEDFKDAFDETIETFERLDIVVNNAGIVGEQTWRKTIDVNLIGVLQGIQIGLDYLSLEKGGNGGVIVNTASTEGFQGTPLLPVYCATKHAVVGLTRSYGCDYHFNKTGVKVKAICPGKVDTAIVQQFLKTCLDEKEAVKFVNSHKSTDPKELGRALLKVLKDDNNGCFLKVDASGMEYL